MTLVNCKHCENRISDQISTCPHCGQATGRAAAQPKVTNKSWGMMIGWGKKMFFVGASLMIALTLFQLWLAIFPSGGRSYRTPEPAIMTMTLLQTAFTLTWLGGLFYAAGLVGEHFTSPPRGPYGIEESEEEH